MPYGRTSCAWARWPPSNEPESLERLERRATSRGHQAKVRQRRLSPVPDGVSVTCRRRPNDGLSLLPCAGHMSTTAAALTRRTWAEESLNKVPAITATFWLIKILSTTIGETFADFLAVNVGLGTAVTDGAMFAVLAVTLFAQLRTRRYTPWLYWLTVVLVSIVGTQITDFFTDQLGVSLYVSTA